MPETVSRPSCRSEFRQALTQLIACGLSSRRRQPARVEIHGETPLFSSGLVDSLAILELIAFVEEATGRAIPAREVQLKHFGTIDRICASFWRDEPAGEEQSGVTHVQHVQHVKHDQHGQHDRR